MDEVNNKEIIQEGAKRKTSGWETGIPVLQIFLIVFEIVIMMSSWDSNSFVLDKLPQIIFFIVIFSPIFSFFLFLRSKKTKGKKYGIIAFIVSIIIPLILLYIGLTYGF